MTSQLILANGHGIALASDSAVTFGRSRTYETSEKVYPLPLPHRVAVLHAGSVMCHGMPYTTLINEWILSLGEVQLRTVQHYQESFDSWLNDNIDGWASQRQLKLDFLSSFSRDIERIWRFAKDFGDELTEESFIQILQKEIDSQIEFSPEVSSSHSNWSRRIYEQIEPKLSLGEGWSICEMIEYWFDDVPMSEQIREMLNHYAYQCIERRYPMSVQDSCYLTFVGYGSGQIVPSYLAYEIYGHLGDWTYGIAYAPSSASREGNGMYLIRPIGQHDAIDLVLRGYSTHLLEATKSKVSGLMEPEVGVESGEENRSENVSNKVGDAIEGAVRDLSESNNLEPLRRTIAGLPLMTLVSTARSLIEVQQLSLNIRGLLPTVGGQVKVGVLTKSHGFEWVTSRDIRQDAE
jgi:hypothetical protein